MEEREGKEDSEEGTQRRCRPPGGPKYEMPVTCVSGPGSILKEGREKKKGERSVEKKVYKQKQEEEMKKKNKNRRLGSGNKAERVKRNKKEKKKREEGERGECNG